MRFQVPQFIETETKIVGPFTLKQFLWIAGGVAIIFFLFMILPLYAFIIFSVPIGAIFGSLAFIKIDNIPLFNYFVYSIAYMLNPRRYFFKKITNPNENFNQTRSDEKIKTQTKTPLNLRPQPLEIDKEFNETKHKKEKKKDDDNDQQSDGYIKNEYIVR